MEAFEKIYHPSAEDCTEAGLLRLLEDAALLHSLRLGIRRETLLERYNCLWMLGRSWYRFPAPPQPGKPLPVSTWLARVEPYSCCRAHRTGGGGESLELWVLVDADTRRLVPTSHVPELSALRGRGDSANPAKVAPPRTGQMIGGFSVSPEDLDGNGHMNNTRHVLHALRLLRKAERCPAFFRELRVSYSRECRLGDGLRLLLVQRPDGYLLSGIGEDGQPRFSLLAKS